MRLPQSCSISFSIRLLSITVLLFCAAVPRVHARGTTQQLSSSPANLRFGSVAITQSETQSVALTNNGQTGITISAVTASCSGFSVSGLNLPAVVAAGQSVTLSVNFAPVATGWIDGNVTVTSNAANPSLQIGLRGTGVNSDFLTAAPSSLSFGKVSVGSNSALSVVLTNSGAGTKTLTAFQTVGSSFSVSGPTLPVVLNPGQTVALNVTFTPQATGAISGSVFVPGPNLNIPLTGTGTTTTVGQLTIAPTSLNFGSVDIGNTTTQPSTISASGGSVTISSASSSSSQFSIAGASFPLTLSAGQSAQWNIVYAPTTSGSASATLTLISNASDAKATESLTGTGVPPQVNLSWNTSTSSVIGYNVYRGTAVGSYSKINTSLDPNTMYTDSNVVSGTTYYYAATAVNSSGQESSYSTPLQVAIP